MSDAILHLGYHKFIMPFSKEISSEKKALDAPEDFGKKARKRFKANFSLRKRENKLREVIS